MKPYKRQRIRTGPKSYRTIIHKRDGTSTMSNTTRIKVGNFSRTRTVSNKGVTFTHTDSGWVNRSFTPAFTKKPKERKFKKAKSVFELFKPKKSKKKSAKAPPTKFANKQIVYNKTEEVTLKSLFNNDDDEYVVPLAILTAIVAFLYYASIWTILGVLGVSIVIALYFIYKNPKT